MAVIVGFMSFRTLFNGFSQNIQSIQQVAVYPAVEILLNRSEFMNLSHLHAFTEAMQRKDLEAMLTHMADDAILKTP